MISCYIGTEVILPAPDAPGEPGEPSETTNLPEDSKEPALLEQDGGPEKDRERHRVDRINSSTESGCLLKEPEVLDPVDPWIYRLWRFWIGPPF